ncbi:MAG: 50S ribosomal protein L33 [Fimbriimonadaceae bacterium]|nr:50S ribosomal protein L33 [Fimbriimonadaceae bacterium]
MGSKSKDVRIVITLECTECRQAGRPGVARYSSSKNRRNNSARMELKKYCRYCRHHTAFRETR